MVLNLRVTLVEDIENGKCMGQVPDSAERIEDGSLFNPWFHDQEEAKDFCNGTVDNVECPIREACLVFALTNNHREGVWGGMSELGRKALRKRWPLRGRVPREEWKWMSEEDALAGVDVVALEREDPDAGEG